MAIKQDESLSEMIERYKKMPLEDQINDWFGDQTTMLRGLCRAQCMYSNETVAEAMYRYEMECIKHDMKYRQANGDNFWSGIFGF